jgi:carbonic anhydrase/acetyltransferase-like protein (isoleucine patch superfamily)
MSDAQNDLPHHIHPTAEVHPSAILEGKVTLGAFTRVGAGTVITGTVTIGHHCIIRCNATIRGRVDIGNFVHIYDNVCIEGGRPDPAIMPGSQTNAEADRCIIGNYCWINHGATMHGTQMADESAVNLNACCDYNTRLGHGAVLANGSATHVDQVIPANCFAEGVPAVITKRDITDRDREDYFGLIPKQWTITDGEWAEAAIRKKMAS